MFQVDPAKTAAQNLIALINSGSSVVFTGTEINIGAVQVHTPTDQADTTNSTFTVTAIEGSGYMGTQSPLYTRLTIGDTRPGAFLTWAVDSTKTRESLITDILTNHQLLASDVTFTGLEGGMPAAGTSGTLTCTAKSDSYFYIGSYAFEVANTDTP